MQTKRRSVLTMTLATLFIAGTAFAAVPFPSKPRDDASCTYEEVRPGGGGSGPRIMRIHCAPPGGQAYHCDYRGNPHSCRWYNSHQAEFYRHLATVAGRYATGCTAGNLEDRKHCPGVIMKKE